MRRDPSDGRFESTRDRNRGQSHFRQTLRVATTTLAVATTLLLPIGAAATSPTVQAQQQDLRYMISKLETHPESSQPGKRKACEAYAQSILAQAQRPLAG